MIALAASPPLAITRLVVERVNGTRAAVRPGGSAPLCRAIFVSAVEVQVRARLVPGAPTRATLVATYPHHVVRRHVVRLGARRGVSRFRLSAADERLPSGGFTAGVYRFSLRAARHRATATLTLTGATTC